MWVHVTHLLVCAYLFMFSRRRYAVPCAYFFMFSRRRYAVACAYLFMSSMRGHIVPCGSLGYLPIGTTPPNNVLEPRPRRIKFGFLGSLTLEPLFVNDPIPPLHATLTQYLCVHCTIWQQCPWIDWCQHVNGVRDIRFKTTTPHYQTELSLSFNP